MRGREIIVDTGVGSAKALDLLRARSPGSSDEHGVRDLDLTIALGEFIGVTTIKYSNIFEGDTIGKLFSSKKPLRGWVTGLIGALAN
jgi:hypothetical protein